MPPPGGAHCRPRLGVPGAGRAVGVGLVVKVLHDVAVGFLLPVQAIRVVGPPKARREVKQWPLQGRRRPSTESVRGCRAHIMHRDRDLRPGFEVLW